MPVAVVNTGVYERPYQSMSSVRSEGSTDDSQLLELEEADTRDVVDVPRQRHPTVDENSQIANTAVAAPGQGTPGRPPWQASAPPWLSPWLGV